MMCVIVGKSGSGKSTVEMALEVRGFQRIISSTSRKKRRDEVDGESYIFRSTRELLNKAAEGKLIEYQFIAGEIYGIEEAQFRKGERNVAVVGIEGLKELKKLEGANITSFYLKVPFYVRLIRMIKRRDPLIQIVKRLKVDSEIFKGIEGEVDYIIDGCGNPGQIAGLITKKLREWE